MNKIIVNLANKAGVEFDWDPGTGGPEVYFDRQEDFEKFAELIVKECIKLSGDAGVYCQSVFEDLAKEHFGIE